MIQCDNETHFKEFKLNPTSISCEVKPDNTSMIQTESSDDKATSIGLGAVVGLLIVLLLTVIIGWMWTCWTMKKQAKLTTNLRDIR